MTRPQATAALPDGLCCSEQAGRYAVAADLAGEVGEALQDVRETSCASTAAAHPTWGTWLAGGLVAASAGARMRRANVDRSTGSVQSSVVARRASALLSLRCVARQVDILAAACGVARVWQRLPSC